MIQYELLCTNSYAELEKRVITNARVAHTASCLASVFTNSYTPPIITACHLSHG